MLVVLWWRRRSEERRVIVRVSSREAKHHWVVHGRPIMMMLMVLMVIDIANVHVVAHGASWMQREGLRIVVREACHIRPIASKHVLLVRLLLLAL